jgi:hypothetical protein
MIALTSIYIYENVSVATIHGVSGILWISISTQVENNLKNK